LEQLKQQFNDRDIDRIVNSILNVVLDNELTEMERPPNRPQLVNQRRFGLALVGGPSENLMESKTLLLPNFPMQDYTLLSVVLQPTLYVPLL
jgi:hypothetical protein